MCAENEVDKGEGDETNRLLRLCACTIAPSTVPYNVPMVLSPLGVSDNCTRGKHAIKRKRVDSSNNYT